MKPAVILLLQATPPQFNNPMQNTYLGLVMCCLFLIQFSCCVQIWVIICWNGLEALLLCLCSGIFSSIHFSQLLTALFTYLLGLIAHAVTPLFIFIGLTLSPRSFLRTLFDSTYTKTLIAPCYCQMKA